MNYIKNIYLAYRLTNKYIDDRIDIIIKYCWLILLLILSFKPIFQEILINYISSLLTPGMVFNLQYSGIDSPNEYHIDRIGYIEFFKSF